MARGMCRSRWTHIISQSKKYESLHSRIVCKLYHNRGTHQVRIQL